ncbi:MAG TPA: MOSC domain-containing protein [Holophagaceae bacterium]|nr:MOSC domain-containing protein [Holophagaceae bacterium]
MRRLGTIIRIQIQLDRLKSGEEPRRIFDPRPIRSVAEAWVGPEGLVAPWGEGQVLDVHHRNHPHSRNREGRNAVSLGFEGHYALMRTRFGERLSLGAAGENFIVSGAEVVTAGMLAGGVILRLGGGGELRLREVHPAPPCAPFAQWALGHPEGEVDPQARKEALVALGEGIRGFYACMEGAEPVRVGVGDEVWALG